MTLSPKFSFPAAWHWAAAYAAAFAYSYAAWYFGWPSWAWLPVAAALAWCAVRRPAALWAVWLGELLLGGHGHGLMAGGVSLRQIIFVALIVAACARLSQLGKGGIGEALRAWRRDPALVVFAAVAVAALVGTAQGLLNGYGRHAVLAVADNWLAWAMLPVAALWPASWWRERFENAAPAALGAVAFLAAFGFVLFVIFSFGWSDAVPTLYHWARQAGLGEITRVTDSYYRVFLYGQIFALAAWAWGLFAVSKASGRWELTKGWLLLAVAELSLYVSLSRSFWVAQAAVTLGALCWFGWRGLGWKKITFTAGVAAVSLFATGGFVEWTAATLNPAYVGSAFGSRITDEDAAGASRRQLLVPLWNETKANWLLGRGFGATVTFRTSDPRILASNPSGIHTTAVFEWGHLGNWLQLGLFGYLSFLAAWAYLAFVLLRCAAREGDFRYAALALALGGVIATHAFTPFADHPLGIGLAVCCALVARAGLPSGAERVTIGRYES